MTSFFGRVDLVSIWLFYLALGADLRSLRVFWVLKLARYSMAMQACSVVVFCNVALIRRLVAGATMTTGLTVTALT